MYATTFLSFNPDDNELIIVLYFRFYQFTRSQQTNSRDGRCPLLRASFFLLGVNKPPDSTKDIKVMLYNKRMLQNTISRWLRSEREEH